MHQDPQAPFHLPELPDSVGQIQPFPRPVVWTAGLIILLLGVLGLYQGLPWRNLARPPGVSGSA